MRINHDKWLNKEADYSFQIKKDTSNKESEPPKNIEEVSYEEEDSSQNTSNTEEEF